MFRRSVLLAIAGVMWLGCDDDPDGSDASHDGGRVSSLEVMTARGPVVGERSSGSLAFLGIPYAAPPLGSRRWAPPAAPDAWTEPVVSRRPPRCPQIAPSIGNSGAEDCLYINVHTPDPIPTSAPVLVWIHGGGFAFGEAAQIDGGTLGDRLAADLGVIVVSMNYRLGPLGFLAHADLTAEAGVSGNYGLMDQRLALEWVRDEIEAFGGDPGNVTLFGESAGGFSVCAHLIAPGSAGLFHRAIIQSGFCDSAILDLEAAESIGDEFFSSLGCEEPEDALRCAREVPASEIVTVDETISGGDGELGSERRWYPIVDGSWLLGTFRQQVTAGRFENVPTIVGWNADEGTLFVMLAEQSGTAMTEELYEEVASDLATRYGVESNEIRAAYPLAAFDDPGAAIAAMRGDANLACPSRRSARILADAGVPTHLYYFTFPDAAFQISTERDLGAFHSAEIQYIFGHPVRFGQSSFRGDDLELHRLVSGLWVSMAEDGVPSVAGGVDWPRYDSTDDRHLVLDRSPMLGSAASADVCALWGG